MKVEKIKAYLNGIERNQNPVSDWNRLLAIIENSFDLFAEENQPEKEFTMLEKLAVEYMRNGVAVQFKEGKLTFPCGFPDLNVSLTAPKPEPKPQEIEVGDCVETIKEQCLAYRTIRVGEWGIVTAIKPFDTEGYQLRVLFRGFKQPYASKYEYVKLIRKKE